MNETMPSLQGNALLAAEAAFCRRGIFCGLWCGGWSAGVSARARYAASRHGRVVKGQDEARSGPWLEYFPSCAVLDRRGQRTGPPFGGSRLGARNRGTAGSSAG